MMRRRREEQHRGAGKNNMEEQGRTTWRSREDAEEQRITMQRSRE